MNIGNFKANTNVGAFKFVNSVEGAHLRKTIEKFYAKNPITDTAWQNYAELRALRTLGQSVETEEEAQTFDKIWSEFCSAVDTNGSSKFGVALETEKLVRKVQPWC